MSIPSVASEALSTVRTSCPRRVAVVGAGLAGLICAHTLGDHGHEVTVFDKGRKPGGRASSRAFEGRTFDHGAQYFTARSPWLETLVASWERDDVVSRWTPRGKTDDVPWWVGAPTMGALATHLAMGLDVRSGQRITRIDGSTLLDGDVAVSTADHIVVALPAPQARDLVGELGDGELDPCWAVLLVIAGKAPASERTSWVPEFDVIRTDGPVAWAARESSKPGRQFRPDEDAWTLHLSVPWSNAHLEDNPDAVCHAAAQAFLHEHAPHAHVVAAQAHRWRFARARRKDGPGYRADPARSLIVCGDWLASPRIEGALASGLAAARRLLADLPAT